MTLTNDASEAVTLTVTVRRASGDTASPPVYEATHSLAPGGAAEAHDVLPASDAYRVTVDVAGGTTETATVEAAPTRYGAVSIRVERTDAATVGWLDVVPPPTPTACP